MTFKKNRIQDQERDPKRAREENHLSEKHLRNAFKSKSFNLDSLDEEDLDNLGFYEHDEHY